MAIKKHGYGVIHGTATCLDCEWETESYKNAQAIAKIHADKHGHKVNGELGIAFMYDGREGEKSGQIIGGKNEKT